MERKPVRGPALGIGLSLLGALLLLPPARAADAALTAVRAQAEQLERAGQWDKAAELYDQLLARDRTLPDVHERYHQCCRRAQLQRRHRDASYRQQLGNADLTIALKLYREIVGKLRHNYIDQEPSSPAHLFQHGVEELSMDLEDETFRQNYLPFARMEAIRQFQTQLNDLWAHVTIRNAADAQAQLFEVALAAQKALRLRPAVTVFEFACGACSGLDEHTFYLTPHQLREVYTSLAGEVGDVGLTLTARGRQLLVADVLPGGPAALEQFKPGDRILRINHQSVRGLTPEAAAERLAGDAGTTVEVQVLSAGDKAPHTVKLVRQARPEQSVMWTMLQTPGLAYCRIAGFQKATAEDLDRALAELKMAGMKGLILDLRGNPGGLFPVAVQVAERFLTEGIIVTTQSQTRRDQNHTYRARNPGAMTLPLVILIDGETASAAEIVAGALKDNQRATLVGQPSYGKGCIQEVLELETVQAGGIRVTLARFFSPRGQAYNGAGVTPHIAVERTPPMAPMSLSDRALEVAQQALAQLVGMRP